MSADTTSQHQNRLPVIPPLQTAAKIISTQPALLTVTHPFIPSQEGKSHTTNHSLPRRKHHQKPPLLRGAGGCHACAQPPKTKATTQSRQIPPHYTKHKKYLLSKQQQKHLILSRTPHRNTPLNPLSRGEISHHKPLIINKKQDFQASSIKKEQERSLDQYIL